MKKIITIVVILAVLWAIPAVRGRIGVAALPLLEKLGPVADFVVTPAKRFSAKNDASNIMRVITTDFNEGRPVPDARTFQEWLKRRAPLMAANDPWERPYWLVRGRGTITVGSSGVDGKKDTKDDVTHSVPF
jgi:hypothetical protein